MYLALIKMYACWAQSNIRSVYIPYMSYIGKPNKFRIEIAVPSQTTKFAIAAVLKLFSNFSLTLVSTKQLLTCI